MRCLSILPLLIALLCAAPPASAQVEPGAPYEPPYDPGYDDPEYADDPFEPRDAPDDRRTLDLTFVTGLPQGRFADEAGSTGFGFDLTYTRAAGQGPLRAGFDLGLLVYDNERRRVDDAATELTSHFIVQGHLLLRVQPRDRALRPYGDLLFGTKALVSTFTVDEYGETFYAERLNHDFALSYGAGGGVMWRLDTYGWPLRHVHLNLGVRYLFGPRATYMTGRAVDFSGAEETLETHRTRTDMIVPHFGFAVTL